MSTITERLNAYIDAHPFDPGDGDCETVLEQLYRVYAESHESDSSEIHDGFSEMEEIVCTPFHWKRTIPSSISAAASAVQMNAKPSSTACSMAHIL